MGTYSVNTANAELEGMLHGTTLNQIQNIFGVYNRAGRQLLLDLDPQETLRTVPLPPLYDQIFYYAAPVDLKGNKVVDIRPQVNRTFRDRYIQQYSLDFDINKKYTLQPNFNVDFNTGIKSLFIDSPQMNTGILLNYAESPTDNGTWNLGGTASNLTVDNINYIAGNGSLTFDVNLGIATISNSTMTAQNLTNHLNQSVLFLWVYLPAASSFNSVTLKWGSSPSDYWYGSATTNQEGTSFQNGWNLLAIPWYTADDNGNPDVTAVNFLEVDYDYSGPLEPNVKLNYIVSRLGVDNDIEYYSKFLFRDAVTGAFKETVTKTSDLINLDTDTYNVFVWQLALQAVQQAFGANSMSDIQMFTGNYVNAVQKYKMMYKSQVSKAKTTYYRKPGPPYGSFSTERYNW